MQNINFYIGVARIGMWGERASMTKTVRVSVDGDVWTRNGMQGVELNRIADRAVLDVLDISGNVLRRYNLDKVEYWEVRD